MSLQSPPQICPALYNHLFSPPSTGNASHLRLLLLFLPHRKVSLPELEHSSSVKFFCIAAGAVAVIAFRGHHRYHAEEKKKQTSIALAAQLKRGYRKLNSMRDSLAESASPSELWMLLLFSYLLSTSTIASRGFLSTTTTNNNSSSRRRRSRTRRAIELTIYVQRLIISCTTHCTAQTRLQAILEVGVEFSALILKHDTDQPHSPSSAIHSFIHWCWSWGGW